MRPNTIIFGIAMALMLAAPAPADDAAGPSLTAIAAALHAGRAADAEAMATQMLAAGDPVPLNNAYLLLDRGLAREQLGKRTEAESDFTTVIDSKTLPRNELARALFDRGVILDELGRTEEAIADYGKAVELIPRYATALNNRGNAYRRTGRYALARRDYEAALSAGDDEPEYPLYGLGRVAEALGDPTMAKAYYQRSLAANGNFTPASRQLAMLGSVGNAIALHAPGEQQPSTQIEHRDKASVPATKTADTSADNLDLRPAILDVGKKQPARSAAPAHAASFVPPEPAAGNIGNTGDLVQLGAWRSQGDAALGWDKAAATAGDLLNGATPRIVEADVPGKGHFWRLRTQAPAGTSAEDFCGQLRAKGLNCIAAKS